MATILSAGDIGFARVRADAPDSFSFVALRAIEAGTVIHFTDNAVNADGALRPNEGTVSWTAPAGGVAAGGVIALTSPTDNAWTGTSGGGAGSGGFNLSAANDQIVAYQGPLGSPERFLAAVSTNNFLSAGAATAQDSYLPPGLVVGETALVLPGSNDDNAVYAGPTAGSAAELRAALNNGANWATNDEPGAVGAAPAGFTVSGGGDAPAPAPALVVSPAAPATADPETSPMFRAAARAVAEILAGASSGSAFK